MSEHRWTADELAHDLDMIVFQLEQTPKDASVEALAVERQELRRKLEALRERVKDLRDALS